MAFFVLRPPVPAHMDMDNRTPGRKTSLLCFDGSHAHDHRRLAAADGARLLTLNHRFGALVAHAVVTAGNESVRPRSLLRTRCMLAHALHLARPRRWRCFVAPSPTTGMLPPLPRALTQRNLRGPFPAASLVKHSARFGYARPGIPLALAPLVRVAPGTELLPSEGFHKGSTNCQRQGLASSYAPRETHVYAERRWLSHLLCCCRLRCHGVGSPRGAGRPQICHGRRRPLVGGGWRGRGEAGDTWGDTASGCGRPRRVEM